MEEGGPAAGGRWSCCYEREDMGIVIYTLDLTLSYCLLSERWANGRRRESWPENHTDTLTCLPLLLTNRVSFRDMDLLLVFRIPLGCNRTGRTL